MYNVYWPAERGPSFLSFPLHLSFPSVHLFVPLYSFLSFCAVTIYSNIFLNIYQPGAMLVLAKKHSRDICKYEFQKWWMTTFALNLCIWQESEQKTSFRLMNWPRWRSRLANAATTWYARTRFELFYHCGVSSNISET